MPHEPISHDPEEDPSLLGIAKAVSDGLPVDWEDAEDDPPETRLLKARLRFLQSIADAHRLLSRPGNEEDSGR